MSETPQTSEFESRARARKAQQLAIYLDSIDVDPDEAQYLDADGREYAARLAGVKVPSEQTWRMVIDLMRGLAARRDDDPFTGLPGVPA